MRGAILIVLVGLGACTRAPDRAKDVSTIAAERAEANIDNYAATVRTADRGPRAARARRAAQ